MWENLMIWMDTTYIPLWIVLGVFILYFAVKLWIEVTDAIDSAHREDTGDD
jgi:hypothetical protein